MQMPAAAEFRRNFRHVNVLFVAVKRQIPTVLFVHKEIDHKVIILNILQRIKKLGITLRHIGTNALQPLIFAFKSHAPHQTVIAHLNPRQNRPSFFNRIRHIQASVKQLVPYFIGRRIDAVGLKSIFKRTDSVVTQIKNIVFSAKRYGIDALGAMAQGLFCSLLIGTILNTLEDLAAAGNHTCEAHGWPTFAVDEYRYKVGNGMLKLVERFMPAEYAGDSRMFEQTLAEFRAYYGEHKEDHTAPYAGTIEMLDRLRAAGVQLAVLTNKDHVSAAPLIEKYFGSERFALVQGRIDAFPPKPEAPVTLHVMEELGADPATTLYVGDSNVDVLTGHNAGLKSAGVSWGFRGRAELEAAGADYVVDTQGELAALILGE